MSVLEGSPFEQDFSYHWKGKEAADMTVTLDTPLTQFPGIGEARGKKLEKLGQI